MSSDLKRFLIAAALAAAAFNATAPKKGAPDVLRASPMFAGTDASPRTFLAEYRPSRIRIGRPDEDFPFTHFAEI